MEHGARITAAEQKDKLVTDPIELAAVKAKAISTLEVLFHEMHPMAGVMAARAKAAAFLEVLVEISVLETEQRLRPVFEGIFDGDLTMASAGENLEGEIATQLELHRDLRDVVRELKERVEKLEARHA